MTNAEILQTIKDSGETGLTAKELKEKCGEDGIWKAISTLKENGEIFGRKDVSCNRYIATEYKTSEDEMKEMKMNPKFFGDELSSLLIDTVAKYATGKAIEQMMPEIRQRCINEFGMTPIVHEVKVGNLPPVKMKGELPPVFDKILKYICRGNNVMMKGPAGTGKGFLARKIAEATGSEFFEVNAVKNEYGLTGFVDANSNFVHTPFYDACKCASEGKNAVFLFDEMDCSDPEALKIFNEALQAREFTFPNNEKIEFPTLRILAACNTFGTGSDEIYAGQPLDGSTLTRFVPVIVDYNRKVELFLAQGDEELVDFIDAFRRQCDKHGMRVIVCYRNIEQIVSMYDELPLREVMKDCLIRNLTDDDVENILCNMTDTDNLYYRACKGENVKWKPRTTDEQPSLELTA